MKHISILVIAVVLASCQNPMGTDASIDAKGAKTVAASSLAFAPTVNMLAPTCDAQTVTYALTAGQTTSVGTVSVDVDGDELSITFASEGSWTISETHVQIDGSAPVERGAPGQYAHGNTSHNPAVTSFTYTYSLAQLGLGSDLYIRAHAVVSSPTNAGETAYGGDIQKPKGSWYGVMGYKVTDLDCGPKCAAGPYFPTWGQDISHITLVFKQDKGDVKGGGGDGNNTPDGYYTVKINGQAGGRDLDQNIATILAWLEENDSNFISESNLMGVVIKGGIQTTGFYAYGCFDSNGEMVDTLPAGIGFGFTGSGNESPANAIDRAFNTEF